MDPSRRSFLTSILALFGVAPAILTLESCATTTPVSVLTGLIASASAVIAGIINSGLVPPQYTQWITAGSKFVADVAAELASTDTPFDKVSKSLLLFTSDFAGVQFPTEVGTIITVAILAINAIAAFLKAQTPAVTSAVMAHATRNKAKLSTMEIPATPSSADKKILEYVQTEQKQAMLALPPPMRP